MLSDDTVEDGACLARKMTLYNHFGDVVKYQDYTVGQRHLTTTSTFLDLGPSRPLVVDVVQLVPPSSTRPAAMSFGCIRAPESDYLAHSSLKMNKVKLLLNPSRFDEHDNFLPQKNETKPI